MPTPGTKYQLFHTLVGESTLDMVDNGNKTETITKLNHKSYELIEFATNKKIITTLKYSHPETIVNIDGVDIDLTPEEQIMLNEPVVGELRKDKWVITNFDLLNKEQQQEANGKIRNIALTFNSSLYGYEPRKVGDTWKANEEMLTKLLGNNKGLDKASATIKFTSLEIRGKKHIGSIRENWRGNTLQFYRPYFYH